MPLPPNRALRPNWSAPATTRGGALRLGGGGDRPPLRDDGRSAGAAGAAGAGAGTAPTAAATAATATAAAAAAAAPAAARRSQQRVGDQDGRESTGGPPSQGLDVAHEQTLLLTCEKALGQSSQF